MTARTATIARVTRVTPLVLTVALGTASVVGAAESTVVYPAATTVQTARAAKIFPIGEAQFDQMLREMRLEIRREIRREMRREMTRFAKLELDERQREAQRLQERQRQEDRRLAEQREQQLARQERERQEAERRRAEQLALAPTTPTPPAGAPANAKEGGRLIATGSRPGDAACLTLPARTRAFGTIALGDWNRWVDGVRFAQNSDALSVEKERDGRFSLRQRYVPASNGTARVMMGATLPEARTYRLVQSFRLDPGWDWGIGRDQGGKLGFGLSGGTSPTGGAVDPAGFSARLAWRGNKDGTARLNVYSYAADRPGVYGEDLDAGLAEIPVGEWFQVAMEVKTNSAIGRADGGLRVWIDGRLTLDRSGIAWQSAGDRPAVDNLYYASFYGGNSRDWGPRGTTHARVADACWSPVIGGYSGIDPEAGRLRAPRS